MADLEPRDAGCPSLVDRTVFVTGGADGIGSGAACTARQFLVDGGRR